MGTFAAARSKAESDASAPTGTISRIPFANGPARVPSLARVRIMPVETKKDLRQFIQFPMRLYRACPYYVPPLIRDELETFDRKKSPVFDNADGQLFLAFQDNEVVGRIAAIINTAANEKYHTKNLRFGWFDSINDVAVATALFRAAERWGKERGMETVSGPEGFNGFDRTGVLVEGFDSLPTMATNFNYSYYDKLVSQYEFEKEVDLVEYRLFNIDKIRQRFEPIATKILNRGKFHLLELTGRKMMLSRAYEVIDLMEETYADLYDSFPLTPRQRDYAVRKFFPFLRLELIKVVVDENDQMVGFFIAMPSLSKALQKANGRLFPFGFLHLLKAVKRGNETLDFCLAGVKKEYRGKGIDVIMGTALLESAARLGFTEAETNPELEGNKSVRDEWRHFERVQHRRRRIYSKKIL